MNCLLHTLKKSRSVIKERDVCVYREPYTAHPGYRWEAGRHDLDRGCRSSSGGAAGRRGEAIE